MTATTLFVDGAGVVEVEKTSLRTPFVGGRLAVTEPAVAVVTAGQAVASWPLFAASLAEEPGERAVAGGVADFPSSEGMGRNVAATAVAPSSAAMGLAVLFEVAGFAA